MAPLIIIGPLELITFAAPTIIAVRPNTPTKPVVISSKLRLPIFFKADARIRTAVDTANIAVQVFNTPIISPLTRPNKAIVTIKSANKTVIAPNAPASLSLSIKDITNIAAANIPIAVAILISASAFNLV